MKQKLFPDSSSLLLPLFFAQLAYQNFRQTYLSALDEKIHGNFIIEPAETITLLDNPRDNDPLDMHGIEMEIKGERELILHTLGLAPDERIPPPQHHRFTVQITPHLTMDDNTGEINISFEVTIRDNYGNTLDTGYELVTEEINGIDETFIVINPVNPAYTLLGYDIRINTREIYNPQTVTLNELIYAFFLEELAGDPGYILQSNIVSSITIDLEESSDDEDDEETAPTARRNSFYGFMLDDDEDDDDEEEDDDAENVGKPYETSEGHERPTDILGDQTNIVDHDG